MPSPLLADPAAEPSARRWARTATPVSLHAREEARVADLWVRGHQRLLEPLDERLRAHPDLFRARELVCVGCGAGRVLADVARRLPTLEHLVGLDLSVRQVALGQRSHTDPRLVFVAADALRWIPAHARAGRVYLFRTGTLADLSPGALAQLLAGIARAQAPALLALAEPLAAGFDAERAPVSQARGDAAPAFSHPYPRLLAQAGWRVCWQDTVTLDAEPFLLLVAEARPDPAALLAGVAARAPDAALPASGRA